MLLLIQYTLIFASVLILVALGGCFSEHSGVINIGLEGIMVMEALDGLPPVKVHCSLLAEEAIHAALWDYAEKHHIEIKGLQKPVSDISEHEEDEEY